MSRQSPIRLYRHRARELKHLPKEFFDTAAFIDPSNPEVTVVIWLSDVDKDPLDFYRIVNHETLHTVYHRMGFSARFNRQFDAFVAWRQNHCVRLNGRDWELTLIEVGL